MQEGINSNTVERKMERCSRSCCGLTFTCSYSSSPLILQVVTVTKVLASTYSTWKSECFITASTDDALLNFRN